MTATYHRYDGTMLSRRSFLSRVPTVLFATTALPAAALTRSVRIMHPDGVAEAIPVHARGLFIPRYAIPREIAAKIAARRYRYGDPKIEALYRTGTLKPWTTL